MNMHCCLSKTDCPNKFSIPKWYENTPFNNSNVTHGGDIKYITKIWNYCDCVEVPGYPYYENYNITNTTTLPILFQPIHNAAFADGI